MYLTFSGQGVQRDTILYVVLTMGIIGYFFYCQIRNIEDIEILEKLGHGIVIQSRKKKKEISIRVFRNSPQVKEIYLNIKD